MHPLDGRLPAAKKDELDFDVIQKHSVTQLNATKVDRPLYPKKKGKGGHT